MYQCPSCGAGLVFDPKTQMLKCNYCNTSFNPKEIEQQKLNSSKEEKGIKIAASTDEINNSQNEKNDQDIYDAIVYRCTQCGAELITTDETIATFCSYCGSSAILEKRNEKKQKPSYVIPFVKTKQECEEAYKNKLKRAFFAPKNMIDNQQVEKIRGIYMPYWIYSFGKNGSNVTSASKYSRRVGDYVYYTDYRITTQVNAKCSGITHDATSNFSDTLSEAIAPFSVKDKKEFSPTYLSGFYADSEDVEKGTYYDECNEIADKQASKELAKDPIYNKYNAKPDVYMNPTSTELGLFPVYFLATRNKTGDRISYAVVNGQTGKVAAEIPIDFKKYIITSLILAIPIFILLNAFFTLTPTKVLGIAVIFGIISLLISNKQITKIFYREKNIDDKGYVSRTGAKIEFNKRKSWKTKKDSSTFFRPLTIFVLIYMTIPLLVTITTFIHSKMVPTLIIMTSIIGFIIFTIQNSKKSKQKISNEKLQFGERIKKIYKPIIGIIVAILILILNPVSDLYYYGGAILSILMTIWSFYDIIKELNLLTTRKLPQLGKRGGDENA